MEQITDNRNSRCVYEEFVAERARTNMEDGIYACDDCGGATLIIVRDGEYRGVIFPTRFLESGDLVGIETIYGNNEDEYKLAG